MFSCEIRTAGWHPFEEEDAHGPVVHILGPDNPAGTYRTGFDVRYVERSQPGFVEAKKAVEIMRRSDKATSRSSTSVRPMRVASLLGRVFEVVETRLLPPDRLPASETEIHHYIAIVPSGENYFVIRLSSSRDVYLDFKDDFARFLKEFKPLGYR